MRRMRRKRTGVKRRLPNKTIYHFLFEALEEEEEEKEDDEEEHDVH